MECSKGDETAWICDRLVIAPNKIFLKRWFNNNLPVKNHQQNKRQEVKHIQTEGAFDLTQTFLYIVFHIFRAVYIAVVFLDFQNSMIILSYWYDLL